MNNKYAPTRGEASAQPLILSDQQGFDRRWFATNLKAVYVPTKVDQVEGYVGNALSRFGKNVKVTSGRHCYENFVYNNETEAVIDMSGLNQTGFDADENAWFIDAGCENWSVYRTLLNTYGKTLPAGSCYSVGAGGHITGGGYGLLSRLHGLTVDHLSAVDIVTWDATSAQARLRRVSKTSKTKVEQDLFWALTGGGCGNFGVIVRYWFDDLPDAPDHATIYTLAWDWEDMDISHFTELLQQYAKLMNDKCFTDNVFTLLKLTHKQAKEIAMVMQIVSEPTDTFKQHCKKAEQKIKDIRQHFKKLPASKPLNKPIGGHPGYITNTASSVSQQNVTYLEALQTLNSSGPNQFSKYKSAYMNKGFPDDQIKTIYKFLTQTPHYLDHRTCKQEQLDLTQCLLQVDSYGGAINKVSSTATAVPQRSSIMKLQYQAYWLNEAKPDGADQSPYKEQSEAYLNWINGFYYEVYKAYGGTPNPNNDPDKVVDGAYYNYPDNQLGTNNDGHIDKAMWLYFLDNFRNNKRNLVEVKKQWDPQNYFNHAQSIPLNRY